MWWHGTLQPQTPAERHKALLALAEPPLQPGKNQHFLRGKFAVQKVLFFAAQLPCNYPVQDATPHMSATISMPGSWVVAFF